MQRPLIFLTQRVDVVAHYGERRDAIDQAWIRLLSKFDCDVVPVPNDPVLAHSLLHRIPPDLVVLSGGNGVLENQPGYAPERNATEAALLDWARMSSRPVLGICRGFQFMNVFLGGTLHRVEGHVAKDHSIDLTDSTMGSVNSFHDFAILPADLSHELSPCAWASDGTIEAARHPVLPWYGMMWHPERPMPDPVAAENWFRRCVDVALGRRNAGDVND